MSERQRSLGRIIALQAKAKTIAAARLAGAEARKAEVTAAREALQSFVEGADLTGAFAVMAAGQTRSLAAREVAAEGRRDELAAVWRRAETRLKLAERVSETVARDEQAVAERRALERLIEEAVVRDATGQEP